MSSNTVCLRRKDDPTRTDSSSRAVQRRRKEPVDIRCSDDVWYHAFLADGEHIVSGDAGGKIRYWRVDDGSEVGTPMDAGSHVCSIAVSQDGRWIVSGTMSGTVQLWDAETRGKVREIGRHRRTWVRAVDVSTDGTKIATGSGDKTLCVWSLSTGDQLLGPLEHENWVIVAKFSPDGRLVASATWQGDNSVRVYDEDGRRLVDVPIRLGSTRNHSIVWSSDGKQLFVLSTDGNLYALDAITGKTSSKWSVHAKDAWCVVLASNGTFVAVSTSSSVSLWDTTTHQQIGSTVHFNSPGWSLAISDDYDLATSAMSTVSIRNLGDILPPCYTWRAADIRPETFIELRNAQRAAEEQNKLLHDEIERLNETNEKLRRDLAQSQGVINEHKAQAESLHSQQIKANDEIMRLEQANKTLRNELLVASSEISENQDKHERETEVVQSRFEQWKSSARLAAEQQHELLHEEIAQLKRANEEHQCAIRMHEQKYQLEALYAQGRPIDVAKKLLEIESSAGKHIKGNKFLSDWLTDSIRKWSKTLETNGDDASNAGKCEEAVTVYATAMSLGSLDPPTVLAKWAGTALTIFSVREALGASVEFKASKFAICRAICTALEEVGRLSDAVETFRQMRDDLRDSDASDERTQWEHDFQDRYVEKLVNLAEAARDGKNHEEAIQCYSLAISLDPTNLNDVLLKRANELIELDPSSHKGYEEKHTALHGVGRYSKAFEAFEAMLLLISQSRDPKIRELRHRFIDATSAIRKEIGEAIRQLPTVLIDTDNGRLYDKTQQAAAFEKLPIYNELRSSMTKAIDHSRIRREVTKFYRYVMFSHKWQLGEPTYQQVENDSVYSLPSSPTFDKLRNFCKLVVALQYKWAWSDTCCVNQLDKAVQQESIVAMFRWYRRSSLTLVHLLGVLSESEEADRLRKSIWNTRGWTYQEYVASEVVQFYTEDWKPYLGLRMFNHKDSPAVLSEMELATNVAAQQLIILQPGLDRAREKLYLASGRQTEREEDMAYSLFGIFGVALPVVYGEGNLAIGRLLEYILMQSAEVTLLAWTGQSGSLHSYLPASLTVYNEIVPLHVPAPIETSEMDQTVLALRSSIPDLSIVIDLYEHLYDLPPLSLLAGRLRLPGIVFKLGDLSPPSKSDTETNVHVYRTTTPLLGDIEIKTTADLSEMRGLRLIHPWISPLVDQDFSFDDALFDLPTRALRLLVRLRQPFGGMLLASSGRSLYRRVATDALIVVQVREEAPLSELLDAVYTVQIQ